MTRTSRFAATTWATAVAAALLCMLVRRAGTTLAQSSAPTTTPTTQESIARIGSVPPPAAPLPRGMTRIFDGKTLDGWKQIPADSWTVKNGVLASLGAARGVIY